MADFDRYASFKTNGQIGIVPFISINKKSTDRYVIYDKRKVRLDKLSYEYYNSPDYAWLIMQANPEYGSIENLIPNGVTLRIPYPLQETLNAYISGINNYRELY